MDFELTAALGFSKEVPKGEIEKLVLEANGDLLKRGCPKGKESEAAEAKITETGEKEVRITIKSGRYVRAHDALFRLRNFLAETLGKKLKIGIKTIVIERFHVEGVELEQEALTPIRNPPLVERVTIVDGRTANVEFVPKIDVALIEKGAVVEKVLDLINEKVKQQHYEGKEETKVCVFSSGERKMLYDQDPAVELEKKNWIRRTHGKGQWVFGANFTALANAFHQILTEEIYSKLGFREMIFPKFEPWAVPMRSGHCKSIYPDAYFVAVPKRSDKREWEDVMDHFKVLGEVDTQAILEKSVCTGIMSFAQCPPFWQYLEGRVVADESLPLKVFDWSGPTFRNEAGGTSGLARVEELHRVETLWVGYPDQVKKIGKQLDDGLVRIFNDVLDLEFRRCKVTPWWMAQEGEKGLSEKDELGVGTIDYDAYLPFRGTREKSEWLEFQNLSVIGEKYPKAFGAKGQKGEIWSGCAGGSVERWACAFLAQKGLDTKNWPSRVREMVKLGPDVRFM